MLFTIAGSSYSGKTTAARACARVGGVVRDFDKIGVPRAAHAGWRQWTLERWLRRVLSYQDKVGAARTVPLDEILAAPSAIRLGGIAACLLDVAGAERLRRLDRRDPGRWQAGARATFIGWRGGTVGTPPTPDTSRR